MDAADMTHDPGMTLEHWLLWHWLPWQGVPSLVVVSLLAVGAGVVVSRLMRRHMRRRKEP
ncbi:hypothetical protein B1C78_03050 [Thioalkalivibrio denitrificans]|uniref:Lipopolysaccharide assembly protein A domain-containing protein n=2 Tax=Thioalkalivibrio denitrificans TaxID=108003 RepID=A0A1V3NRK5_9GAMM|nr:hypothetical protein B1C78_03050 [Thioalkalivibrio denitrificans]